MFLELSFSLVVRWSVKTEEQADDINAEQATQSEMPPVCADTMHADAGKACVGEVRKPKRPMNAFLLWARKERRRLHNMLPSRMPNSEISKVLGQKWKLMPEHLKAPYYTQAMKASDAYRDANPRRRRRRNPRAGSELSDGPCGTLAPDMLARLLQFDETNGESSEPNPENHCEASPASADSKPHLKQEPDSTSFQMSLSPQGSDSSDGSFLDGLDLLISPEKEKEILFSLPGMMLPHPNASSASSTSHPNAPGSQTLCPLSSHLSQAEAHGRSPYLIQRMLPNPSELPQALQTTSNAPASSGSTSSAAAAVNGAALNGAAINCHYPAIAIPSPFFRPRGGMDGIPMPFANGFHSPCQGMPIHAVHTEFSAYQPVDPALNNILPWSLQPGDGVESNCPGHILDRAIDLTNKLDVESAFSELQHRAASPEEQ